MKSKEDLSKLGIKTYFCSNVCAAYQKDVYERLGGFVRKTIFNEDMILAGRMVQEGWKIYYAADAKVIHSHNYNCRQQFHRNFDLAVSQADHPEIFEGVPSEGEGMRLVKDTAKYLLKSGRPWLLVSLVCKSGWKYMGYKLGKIIRNCPVADFEMYDESTILERNLKFTVFSLMFEGKYCMMLKCIF